MVNKEGLKILKMRGTGGEKPVKDAEKKGLFPKDWENHIQSGILGGKPSVPVSIPKREEVE
jgi:hypothetical protein